MAVTQVTKALIGEEDLNIGTGTVSRATSTGGTTTITKLNISSLATAPTTLEVDSATPTVSANSVFKTANTVATTITNFVDGTSGQIIWVIIGDALTKIDFTSNTSLRGNGGSDWTPTTNDHMQCVYDGTSWYCNVSDNTTYNGILDED